MFQERCRVLQFLETCNKEYGAYLGYFVSYDLFSLIHFQIPHKILNRTSGMSVFHYGNEADVDWDNKNFHEKLLKNQSNFMQFIESWKEQRDIAINIPMTALSRDHELRKHLESDFEDLSTYDMSLVNMSRTLKMNDLSLGPFTVSIANDGSIVKLIHSNMNNNVSLVSSEHPLGLFRYQTIVKSQLDKWRSEYLIAGSGGYNEYGMPDSFMKGTNLTAFLESGRVRSLYVHQVFLSRT